MKKIIFEDKICLGCAISFNRISEDGKIKSVQHFLQMKYCSRKCWLENQKTLKPWTFETWDQGFIRGDRFRVYRPDYPKASPNGYAFRYHVVWWLKTGEVHEPWVKLIHHKDENKLNDKFENLQMMLWDPHSKLHHTKNKLHTCFNCGIKFKRNGKAKYCSVKCSFKNLVKHKVLP